MKYKIRVRNLQTEPLYQVEVEGEPVTIKGFEEAQLFVHKKFGFLLRECWRVSELTTGFWISESLVSPQQAIKNCTRLLKRRGIERVRGKLAQRQTELAKENEKNEHTKKRIFTTG